jgi:hypothetical protein
VRTFLRAVAVLAALAVATAASCFGYLGSEFTVCYGVFESRAQAEQAADAGRDAGLDPRVEHRPTESAVEFETGETGEDARDQRREFQRILREQGGMRGHPGEGCLERGPIQ